MIRNPRRGAVEKRSVSRCVAIAAHGRRCQQSPFRGSPYCWHHTQSRKIPRPSRPLAPAPAPAARTGRTPLAAVDVAAEPRVIAAMAPAAVDGARMVELLGSQAAILMAWLEGWDDAALRLERTDGTLSTRTVAATPYPRRRPAGEASAL
jgi:hypothetical protein